MADFQDELTLIGRDDKGFGQKILALLGGITSFGTLFPVFSRGVQKVMHLKTENVFLLFKLLYFVAPLAFLFGWLLIINPGIKLFKSKPKFKLIGFEKNGDNLSDVNSRYLLCCIGVQIVLGIILICVTHFCHLDTCKAYLWLLAYFLLAVFISVLSFKIYKDTPILKGSVMANIGYVLMFFLLFIFTSKTICNYKKSKHYNTDYTSYDFIDNADAPVSSLEKRTRNICERFRFKSHLQWTNENLDNATVAKFIQVFKDDHCYKNVDLRPYTELFNAMILDKNMDIHCLKKFIDTNNILSFTYGNNFFLNADKLYLNYRAQKWGNDTIERIAGGNSLAYIKVIDDAMFNSLDLKLQLIETVDNMLKADSLLFLFQKNGLIDVRIPLSLDSNDFKNDSTLAQKIIEKYKDPKYTSLIDKNPIFILRKRQFARFINEQNSIRLFIWMEDFIAYAQRQTQDRVTKAYSSNAWTLQEAQIAGLLIFITFLVTLLIYAIVVQARKKAIRLNAKEHIESLRRGNRSYYRRNKLGSKVTSIKDDLDNDLKLLNYYSFPINIFIGILFALIIPLLKPIKVDEINTSRPDWFLAMPNWNLIGSVSDAAKSAANGADAPSTQDKKEEKGACCNLTLQQTFNMQTPVAPLNLDSLAYKHDIENAKDTINHHTINSLSKVKKFFGIGDK